MPDKKRAAVKKDVLDKKLSEISADEFLVALNKGEISAQHLAVWPEKKKTELEIDPVINRLKDLKLKDFFQIIRGEKKKLELEKFAGYERLRDPGEIFEGYQYEALLDKLTVDLKKRLG